MYPHSARRLCRRKSICFPPLHELTRQCPQPCDCILLAATKLRATMPSSFFLQFLIHALRCEAIARPTTVLYHHQAFIHTQIFCTSENLRHERNIPCKSCSAAIFQDFGGKASLATPLMIWGLHPREYNIWHVRCVWASVCLSPDVQTKTVPSSASTGHRTTFKDACFEHRGHI